MSFRQQKPSAGGDRRDNPRVGRGPLSWVGGGYQHG